MRVLMLGWEFPPRYSGGLGTACEGLTRGLAARGADVLFVTPQLAGGEHASGIDLRSVEGVVPSQSSDDFVSSLGESGPIARFRHAVVDSPLIAYEGARDYDERLSAIRAYRRRLGLSAADARARSAQPQCYGATLTREVERFARAVLELVQHEPFDVIHAHDWMTFPAGLLVRAQSGRPLVCHVHATEIDRGGQLFDPGIRAVEQQGFDGADRVVCVSRYTKRMVEDNYAVDAAKLRVVPNAVQPAPTVVSARIRPAGAQPVVLFVGRLTKQKGPEHFLAAARVVLQQQPGIQFVLSGQGELLPQLAAAVERENLQRNIHFTGFLEREHLSEMYARADLVVMPSESEPFGLVALEAMQHNVPVILSCDSGAAEELVSGLRVDPRDAVALADKILAVLRHPALGRQLAAEGAREVGTMTWERRAEDVLGLYAELAV